MLVMHIAGVETAFAQLLWNKAMLLDSTQKKMTKYSSEVLLDGSVLTFRPLTFEHFGLWGDGALNYLTELSKKSLNFEGHPNATEFKSYWRQRLGVTVQSCNSEVIFRKLKRLSGKDDINHETVFGQRPCFCSLVCLPCSLLPCNLFFSLT